MDKIIESIRFVEVLIVPKNYTFAAICIRTYVHTHFSCDRFLECNMHTNIGGGGGCCWGGVTIWVEGGGWGKKKGL